VTAAAGWIKSAGGKCYTQEQIAEVVGLTRETISAKIKNMTENGHLSETSHNFQALLYNIWNPSRSGRVVGFGLSYTAKSAGRREAVPIRGV